MVRSNRLSQQEEQVRDVQSMMRRKEWLDSEVARIKESLRQAPAGNLIVSKQHGIARYYHSIPATKKKERSRKYLGRFEEETIRRLAQKQYEEKVLEALEAENSLLTEYLGFVSSASFELVYEKMGEERKEYINPIYLPDEEYLAYWKAGFTQDYSFKPDNGLETAAGEIVRSKSEVIIANELHSFSLPYVYEPTVRLQSVRTVHPDFAVLNVRTRQTIYWEHFGMMDNSEYLERTLLKIRSYAENGYIVGQNLAVTFETIESPLDTALVKSTIEALLL